MSDIATTPEHEAVNALTHGRILKLTASVVAVGTVVFAVTAGMMFGVGFLVGGLFSLINYLWLKSTMRLIFDKAAAGESPALLTIRFILRYALFGVVLAAVYFTGLVSVVAVLLGLASFAVAIVIEGIIRIFSPTEV